MDLYLRKVIHPQAHENYRVVLKRDEGEFEIGSIGIQFGPAAAAEKRMRRGCRLLAPLSRYRQPIGMGCSRTPIAKIL